MDDETAPQTPPFDDDVVLEMAGELRRLATVLVKDVRRNAVLPSLSELAAMGPLHAMLMNALSARLGRPASDLESDGATDPGPQPPTPGYL
jgi:hypothetical protein